MLIVGVLTVIKKEKMTDEKLIRTNHYKALLVGALIGSLIGLYLYNIDIL